MVSPPFKYGELVGTEGVVSADGDSVRLISIGAFGEPGDSSDSSGSEYIDTRRATGWSPVSVTPPATQFRGSVFLTGEFNEIVDYSADLTRTLFAQAPLSSKPVDIRFYLGQPGSSFSEVGPAVASEKLAAWTLADVETANLPKIEYSGATNDLSRVFFSLYNEGSQASWYWPGDITITKEFRGSLYEYLGTDNVEPALVGVKPGSEEAKSRPAEHPSLISTCGIVIGGTDPSGVGRTSESYNAISADGDTVFFTARRLDEQCAEAGGMGPPVNELYARLDGSRTVNIAEPSQEDCARCETFVAEPVRRSPAYFQGASKDGTKAFFLSEQKLLEGAEGDNLYEYNSGAPLGERIALIATRLSSPEGRMGGVVRVSEEGARVYFVSEAVLAHNTDAKHESPIEGADNLYVYDTGTRLSAFVATLSPNDPPIWGGDDRRRVEVTPDGRFLLFASTNRLTLDASGASSQLYRYDAAPSREEQEAKVPQLVRVSIGSDGFNDNGNSADPPPSSFAPGDYFRVVPYEAAVHAQQQVVAISNDGSKVFFRSPVALTPQALGEVCVRKRSDGSCGEPVSNSYEYESGHVYLLSDGQDAHPVLAGTSSLIGANPSGSSVFFTSVDPLVPGDTDTQQDVYVARVDGGFPAAAAVEPCRGEACQGALDAAPVFSAPSSSTLVGLGSSASSSPTPAVKKVVNRVVKCAKGKKRKHSRCVKVSKAKKKAKKPDKSSKSRDNRRRDQ